MNNTNPNRGKAIVYLRLAIPVSALFSIQSVTDSHLPTPSGALAKIGLCFSLNEYGRNSPRDYQKEVDWT